MEPNVGRTGCTVAPWRPAGSRDESAAGSRNCPSGGLRISVYAGIDPVSKRRNYLREVIPILPGRDALVRLVGAVLAEQSDEWTEGRRYMSLEVLAKSRIRIVTTEPAPATEQAVTPEPLTA
jgi:hypothetical protein